MTSPTNMFVRHTLPLEQARTAMIDKETKAAVVVDDNFQVGWQLLAVSYGIAVMMHLFVAAVSHWFLLKVQLYLLHLSSI